MKTEYKPGIHEMAFAEGHWSHVGMVQVTEPLARQD